MTFFLIATFFTQVTMLNMLIAIMGDSYAFATENVKRFSIQTKLDILISQAPSLSQSDREEDKKVFMIVAKPTDDEDLDSDGWSGSINKVVNLTQKSINALEHKIEKNITKL